MTDQALPRAAEAAIAYRRDIAAAETMPVADYATMLAAFAGPTPETGGEADAIIAELIERATPGIRASTGPRFYGWVIGHSHPTGVTADWLASAWGQNAANIVAAPAASAVEAVAADWLLDLLGLPAQSSVGFVTGATVANFVCLAAARSEVLCRVGWDVEGDGMFGAPPVSVLIGAEAHATVYSGLKYLGLGSKRVVEIAVDEAGRMLPSAFEAALKAAIWPVIAIGQAGQINTGASDPFAEIAPMARDAGAWLHVDGAFGLWAQAAPARAHQTEGVELADSWATDGHKWLQTPYDSGFAIVRDGVLLHEMAHTRQSYFATPALAALTKRYGLPDDITDDSLQGKFGTDPAYKAAYEAERDMLFAAAAAPDDATARKHAATALAMLRARRAAHFTGDRAYGARLDDIFLTMEGLGQWVAYAWYTAPFGAKIDPETALKEVRRGGRQCTQDEGLALFLTIDRLVPGWQKRAFAAKPALAEELLAMAAGEK